MSPVIKCPDCRGLMQVADGLEGKTVECPHCRTHLPVTTAPAAYPVDPEPVRSRSGLAITLVILGVVLLFGLVPVLLLGKNALRSRSFDASHRASCMNNIRNVGQASFMWAGDHDDEFMDLVDAAGNKVPTAGIIPTEPSRTGFLLLFNEGYITTTKVFVCPSSEDTINENFPSDYKGSTLAELRAAFGENNCSYGWDPTKKHSVDASCAIIADKPRPTPGTEGDPSNNSENHAGGEGQNVFYNDGHVKWGVTPKPDSGDDPDIYTGATTGRYGGYETSNTDAKIIR